MAPKLTFCEECRDDVEYTVSEVAEIGIIKGNEYHYTGKEARCNQCNALVYIPEIIDSNLDALYASYYRKMVSLLLDLETAATKKIQLTKCLICFIPKITRITCLA